MKSSGSLFLVSLSLLAVLTAIGLRLAFFNTGLTHLPTSADEAQVVLQAKNISRGEVPLLFTGAPYQFPVESYLYTPLEGLMPRNAFGARYGAVLLNLISLFFLLVIFRLTFSFRPAWPGVLLLLIPSSYWLLLQVGYSFVNYNSALVLALSSLLLAFLTRKETRPKIGVSGLAGLLGGLAFSNNMLILPMVLMAGAFLFFDENRKRGLRSTGLFGVGLMIGLWPYLVAKWLIPGAHQAVSGAYSWPEILPRLWSLVPKNLPVVMGITPCFFPDFKETFTLLPGAAFFLTVGYFHILVAVTLIRVIHHLRHLLREKWISLEAVDVFTGISWLALLFFALSRRSHGHTYRYLLPLVWSFPFLLGYLYLKVSKRLRIALGLAAVLLALFNLAASIELMRTWSKPGFASAQADLPDLRPAIQCLDRLGINRCYATMWLASRMAYETDERILCSQPYNTRFFGWPIPYKKEVDASRRVAYVLTQSDRFTAGRFEADLRAMAVNSRRESCAPFSLYYDFHPQQEPLGNPVPRNQLSIRASHNSREAARLKDGERTRRWGSAASQEKGMWLEIALPSIRRLSGLTLYYNKYAPDQAPALKVLALRKGDWRPLLPGVPARLDPFVFLNGHPVYGDKMETIQFPPTQTQALRLEIVEPNPRQDWSMVEIELFQAPVAP